MKPSTPAGVRQLRATALGRFDRRHVTCGPGDRLQMSPPGNLILFRHTPHARPQGCIFASIVFVLPLRPGGSCQYETVWRLGYMSGPIPGFFSLEQTFQLSRSAAVSQYYSAACHSRPSRFLQSPCDSDFKFNASHAGTAHNYSLFRDLARDP